jgi:hypothetical protein
MGLRLSITFLAAGLAGCTAGQVGDTDSGDAGTLCRNNADCDDSIPCTVDTCGAGNVCQHTPVDAQCADGETCVVGRGCIAGACVTAADCDDTFDCTIDTCAVGNICDHQPIDALCAELEVCDAALGCVASGECRTAADCDDAVACTVDNCAVGNVCEHMATDALCAPDERCDPIGGCFVSVPCGSPDDCPVDNFCDGIPRCDPEFGCRPPTALRDCDDRDTCTIDSCDRDLGMCTYAPDCGPPECFAANPSCLWNGCFSIAPTVSQRCAMGSVNYNINQVCFELRGPTLYATTSTSSLAALTQAPSPTAMDFDVALEVSGGCIENYRLAGTLSDADHFAATWTATYTDHDGFSCALGGCAPQTIAVDGTRIP